MQRRHALAFAISILVLAVGSLPGTAQASQKCQCNNGMVVQSMDDDEDACQDACDEFGGGRAWTLDDEQYQGDDVEVNRAQRPRADQPEPVQPARR